MSIRIGPEVETAKQHLPLGVDVIITIHKVAVKWLFISELQAQVSNNLLSSPASVTLGKGGYMYNFAYNSFYASLYLFSQ